MAVIIINDLLAWTVYSAIIFMCYYFCAIPMACVRIIFIKTRFKCRYPGFGWPWLLLVVTNEIRDHKFVRFLKIQRQIKIYQEDRKCNYFNLSGLYSFVHHYCHPCRGLSNISKAFWKNYELWCLRNGYWRRKGYFNLKRVKIRVEPWVSDSNFTNLKVRILDFIIRFVMENESKNKKNEVTWGHVSLWFLNFTIWNFHA